MWWCTQKTAVQNSLGIKRDPISKISNTKWVGGVAQNIRVPDKQVRGPEFSP
jgi:hypothetical protein